jgi:hypothetical protein
LISTIVEDIKATRQQQFPCKWPAGVLTKFTDPCSSTSILLQFVQLGFTERLWFELWRCETPLLRLLLSTPPAAAAQTLVEATMMNIDVPRWWVIVASTVRLVGANLQYSRVPRIVHTTLLCQDFSVPHGIKISRGHSHNILIS